MNTPCATFYLSIPLREGEDPKNRIEGHGFSHGQDGIFRRCPSQQGSDGKKLHTGLSILIVKTSSLGDILHAFPILDYLAEHFPEAKVDWVVEKKFAQLIHAHPLVRKVFEIDSKGWRRRIGRAFSELREIRSSRYDFLFDLQGNCKSGLVTLFAKAKKKVGFGKKSVPEWPNLLVTSRRYDPPKGENIRKDYLYLVAEALGGPLSFPSKTTPLQVGEKEEKEVIHFLSQPKLEGKKILVCPGSAWPNKQLSVDGLVRFCSKRSGSFIWLWGNEDEKGIAHQLLQHFGQRSVLAPKLTLPALQYLMSAVDEVISMDSLPLHLAALTDTPTLSLFGPSLAAKYAPIGKQHTALQGPCPYGKTFEKRCPKLRTCSTGFCMRGTDFTCFRKKIS